MNMNEVHVLHQKAMALAEDATLEQTSGNTSRAKELYAQAFENERLAAELFANHADSEPTRSVLLRSAASLALDCGDSWFAEKLIARALAGNPPPEIADELRDLLEQVYFHRHLDVRGVVLGPREFQMSIDGSAIGHGVAESDLFVGRVQDLERLVYRTAERRAGRPFRERGRPGKALSRDVGLYLSVPRAASFAVTVRLGYSAQVELPGLSPSESIIGELLDCIEVLQQGNTEEIERLIPDPAYRRNFLALARRMAPDGDAVRTVGFTAPNPNGGERRVALTRKASEIPTSHLTLAEEASKQVTVIGTLKYADSTNLQRNEIRLVDSDGNKHRFVVPEGMMDDIVKPLWDSNVKVVGTRERGHIVLVDILKSEEP